jgi:hypothetical protein
MNDFNTMRFDLEEKIMRAWSLSDDINSISDLVGEIEFKKASDQDRLLNLLIGLHAFSELRFNELWDMFEKCVNSTLDSNTRKRYIDFSDDDFKLTD